MADSIIKKAAQLRSSVHGMWSPEVKGNFPRLLAEIFVLHAILQSGDAYRRMDDAATQRSVRDENGESANLQAQVGLSDRFVCQC